MKHKTPDSKGVGEPGFRQIFLSVSLVVGVFGLLYLYNIEGWLINDDEGSFLYQTWRISEGEQPYQDLFTSRWPLFLYTGGGWMRAFGASVVPMRTLSICLTLGTAIIIFLMAHQTLPAEAALLSMVVFLLHPSVVRFGRSFQPEPFYLFFSMLGLYLVARGQAKGGVFPFFGAGFAFAIASMYKLLAALVLMGSVLFLVATWLRNRKPQRRIVISTLALLLPYGILFGLVSGCFMMAIPHFYDSVIGVNIAQGQEMSPLAVALIGIEFLGVNLFTTPLFLLALPAAWQGWRDGQGTALLSWQLPTALAFLLLSRDLFPRLLLYLVPSLVVLFAASLEPIRLLSRRSWLLLAVVCLVIVPWTVNDSQMLLRSEHATMDIVRYIQTHTPPGTYVLSDYQELNFYARRPSTYSGAELSHVILAGGTIKGTDLIKEIESCDVGMVLVDVSPQTGLHIMSLHDYDEFHAYLQQHFALLETLPRNGQLLEVYYREP